MAAGADERRVRTAADEGRLWELVETAWVSLGAEVNPVRRALAAGPPGSLLDGLSVLKGAREAFIEGLTSQCRGLAAEELTALDRVVERKLYGFDSAGPTRSPAAQTMGSCYTRGFAVATGREFYYAVAADVEMAVPWAECEQMCYFRGHVHPCVLRQPRAEVARELELLARPAATTDRS